MLEWLKELIAELTTVEIADVAQHEREQNLERAYNHYLRRGYDHIAAGEAAFQAVAQLYAERRGGGDDNQ